MSLTDCLMLFALLLLLAMLSFPTIIQVVAILKREEGPLESPLPAASADPPIVSSSPRLTAIRVQAGPVDPVIV
jgi:hypothetical protein